jgi:hypothetical protein
LKKIIERAIKSPEFKNLLDLNPLIKAQAKATSAKKLQSDRYAKFRDMGESAITQIKTRSEERTQ